MEPLLLVALGVGVGFFGALLGVGGGVIIVPVLFLVMGLPLQDAVGTSLVVITGTSLVGSWGYLRQRLTEIDLGLEVEVGTLAGALMAAWLAPWLPEMVVAAIFSAVLAVSGVRLLKPPRAIDSDKEVSMPHRRLLLALTPIAGGASGLLGIGGGLVIVPLLRLFGRVDMRRAVATSTLTVGWTASVAAIIYLRRGAVEPAAIPGLLIGIVGGSALAPWVGRKIPKRGLEVVFALMLFWAAWRMMGGR